MEYFIENKMEYLVQNLMKYFVENRNAILEWLWKRLYYAMNGSGYEGEKKYGLGS